MNLDQVTKVINAVEPGWHLVTVAVPTRAIRIIRDDLALKFRVEQLNPDRGVFTWHPVSTHAGDEAWESYGPAWEDLVTKQTRLKEKLKLAQHEARMAQIKAQSV